MKKLYSIIELNPTEWQAYKKLRLESLVKDSIAFLGTVPEDGAYPDIV